MREPAAIHALAWLAWLGAIVTIAARTRNPWYLGLTLLWVVVTEATAKAKAPKADPKPRAKGGKRAEAEANAAAGIMPTPPDFSAATHKPHLKSHAHIVALVEAGDIKGLKAWEHKAYSSSQRALAKYRDLAVIALEARAAQ